MRSKPLRDARLFFVRALQPIRAGAAARLDAQPPWVLPVLGLLGGGALAWGTLQTPIGGVVLAVLLLGLAGYQGRRVRVRLAGELPPGALEGWGEGEPPREREPEPPYCGRGPASHPGRAAGGGVLDGRG